VIRHHQPVTAAVPVTGHFVDIPDCGQSSRGGQVIGGCLQLTSAQHKVTLCNKHKNHLVKKFGQV